MMVSAPSRPADAYSAFLSRLHHLLQANRIAPYATCETDIPGDASDSETGPLSIGTVVEFIDAHPDEALSLDQLADRVHRSKYHFARVFRDEVGIAPWAYVVETRLRTARILLDTRPDLSLTEIALQAGFYDQPHFNRVFKKVEGITPGEYRKDVQAEDEAGD
jgi:transcriptional regulator GlxA family with amidase domain